MLITGSKGWRRVGATLLAALLGAGCAGSELPSVEDLTKILGPGGSPTLDTRTVVAGLKEALEVATERTVRSTGRRDGFLGNPLLRIPLPEELEQIAGGLRAVGLGAQVDELEVSMNRAAERAAAEATPVFVNAIQQMSFADARGILAGGERAATDYFQAHTGAELERRFRPIVRAGMEQVGLVRAYESLVAQVERIPLLEAPRLDLDTYVTQNALDGLFHVLAQEEARIREDPAARTSELLRVVFGGS